MKKNGTLEVELSRLQDPKGILKILKHKNIFFEEKGKNIFIKDGLLIYNLSPKIREEIRNALVL